MLEKYIYMNSVIIILLIIDNCYLHAQQNDYDIKLLKSFNYNSMRNNTLFCESNFLKINDKRDSILQRKNTDQEIPPYMYDPTTALMLSIFPGVFLHGAGHFYAKRYGTAVLLLGTEVLSIFFFIRAPLAALEGGEKGEETAMGAFIGSGIIFIGSWIYDMVVSPNICKKERQKLKRISVQPSVQKMYVGNKIGLKLCYNF